MKNKKGQTSLVLGLFFGIVAIIITTVVGFTIIQSLSGASILDTKEPTGVITVTNESQAWANGTTYPLNQGQPFNTSNSGFTLVVNEVWADKDGAYQDQMNTSDQSFLTVNASGYLSNNTVVNATRFGNLQITYTLNTIIGSVPQLTTAANNLSANLSEGVDRVSEKVPTILKIAVVVLLLGVLVLLTLQARRMGLFESSGQL